MKILAAVVTFNRRELLRRCLRNIQGQTRRPDVILVINNASTDGTDKMLRDECISFITQENIGPAGGWSRAIQHALDEGFDAIWLMDDDGYPEAHALGVLEAQLTAEVACASSIVLREDRPTHFVFPVATLDKAGLPIIVGARRKLTTLERLLEQAPNGTYPFAYLFNGALINLAVACKVGNVNKDFYIYGDEVDYFFRLRQAGKVISVLEAVQFHPDVSQRPYTSAKLYYYVKNTMILNGWHMNARTIRNVLTILAGLGRTAKRNGILKVLSYLLGADAPVLYFAIARGLSGKIGRDFRDWTKRSDGPPESVQAGRSASLQKS